MHVEFLPKLNVGEAINVNWTFVKSSTLFDDEDVNFCKTFNSYADVKKTMRQTSKNTHAPNTTSCIFLISSCKYFIVLTAHKNSFNDLHF